jgi:hypothetical protein
MSHLSREKFRETANAHGTDKSLVHGYHRFYPLIFSGIDTNEKFTIVEIGYGQGKSIPMWKQLFPNSYLVCIDRDISETGDGYKVLQADQDSLESMLNAIDHIPQSVRIIIDDGSHHPKHQLSSFSLLFKDVLEEGGCYFIEDIETSYWLSGNLYGNSMRFGLFDRWSTIEAFKLASDYTNRAFIADSDRSLLEYSMSIAGLSPDAAELVNAITFGQNCIAITKSLQDDSSFANRTYGYSQFTARS